MEQNLIIYFLMRLSKNPLKLNFFSPEGSRERSAEGSREREYVKSEVR